MPFCCDTNIRKLALRDWASILKSDGGLWNKDDAIEWFEFCSLLNSDGLSQKGHPACKENLYHLSPRPFFLIKWHEKTVISVARMENCAFIVIVASWFITDLGYINCWLTSFLTWNLFSSLIYSSHFTFTVFLMSLCLLPLLQIQEFGVTEIRDLKPNGRNVRVTEENKKEYVKLVCQMKMTGAIQKQLQSFLDGFYSIIPKHLISIFNEQVKTYNHPLYLTLYQWYA